MEGNNDLASADSLQAAFEQLCAVKRDELAAKNKIKSVYALIRDQRAARKELNAQYEALQEQIKKKRKKQSHITGRGGIKGITMKLEKLCKEHSQALETKNEIPLDKACAQYSKAWTLDFISKMRSYLPRELRDMIYGYLLFDHDDPREALGRFLGIPVENIECPGKPCLCFTGEDWDLPHYVNPLCIGHNMFAEAADALYSLRPGNHFNPFHASLDELETIVYHDAFHIGLNPATRLKQLQLTIYTDSLVDRERRNIEREMLTTKLNVLHKIVHKDGFNLTVKVVSRRLRMVLLEDVVVAAAPIVKSLKEEGMYVTVTYYYDEKDEYVFFDLEDALKNPESNWKNAVTNFLDEEEDDAILLDCHREYLHENEENYDPAEYHDLEEERDPYRHDSVCSCWSCESKYYRWHGRWRGDSEKDSQASENGSEYQTAYPQFDD